MPFIHDDSNPSLVLHGVGDLRIENRPRPVLNPDQALVQVIKTGICGSDVHYLKHCRCGSYVMEQPMCLGHESAGVVIEVGSAAGLKLGDRVALEPGVGCGICDLCKEGRYELCAKMNFAATPPSVLGTLCKYYALPAHLLHRLPDNVDFEDGAMMEPLSVGVHSVKTLGQCTTNQVVIVFGAGPIGLLCMAVAKALGARRIIAVDIMQDKLDFARSYAATDTFLPPRKEPDESLEAYAARATSQLKETLSIPETGSGVINLAIEASGAPSCVNIGCLALGARGRYVQVGMGSVTTIPVPLFEIINKELTVLGSFRYGPGAYEIAISLVERGLVDVKALVTQRYAFEESKAAFEATKTGSDASGKVVIKCVIDGPE